MKKQFSLAVVALSLGLALTACGSKSSNTTVTAVVADQSVTLSWTGGTNYVADYYIEQSSNGSAFSRVASTIAPTTQATVSNLVKGTTYTFRVQAHNAAGASSYTGTVTATP